MNNLGLQLQIDMLREEIKAQDLVSLKSVENIENMTNLIEEISKVLAQLVKKAA